MGGRGRRLWGCRVGGRCLVCRVGKGGGEEGCIAMALDR